MLSCIQLFVTPWATACRAPLSIEFSRQEYWSELPVPSPADLPDPGIEPMSLASPALAGGFFTVEPPGKPIDQYQNQASDIGTIHRAYSDFISFTCICVCVCVCVVLCNFIKCTDSCNHHHSEDTEQFHHHKAPCSALFYP